MKKQKLSKSIFGIIGVSALVKLFKAAKNNGALTHLKSLNNAFSDLEKAFNAGKKPKDHIKLKKVKLIDFFRK
jgi:hypothetical protein